MSGPLAGIRVLDISNVIAGWIGARPWREAVRQLSQAGVSAGPVYSNRDVTEDAHFRSREAIVKIKDEDFGSVAVPGVVPRLSATPGEARASGPAPGAHNAEVYGDWLGLSAAEQDELRRAGVI